MNVLVSDDDPVVQFLLGSMLSSLGHVAAQATSGAECLDYLATHRSELPEVIFLDMMLGDMSGTEVLRTVRQSYSPAPKIIMVSANPVSELRDLDIQPDFYLEKPFTMDSLREVLDALAARASD